MKRTILTTLAVSMLIALPVIASAAAPIFPGITSAQINGHKVTFLNMSGTVSSMTLSLSTVESDGKLHKETDSYKNGVETKSLADRLTKNFIVPDRSGTFVQLKDVIVFGPDSAISFSGLLLTPTGNKAIGPVNFSVFKPPISQDVTLTRIDGGAEAAIMITKVNNNTGTATGTIVFTKLQPRRVLREVYRNFEVVSSIQVPVDATVKISAGKKVFFPYTSSKVPSILD